MFLPSHQSILIHQKLLVDTPTSRSRWGYLNGLFSDGPFEPFIEWVVRAAIERLD